MQINPEAEQYGDITRQTEALQAQVEQQNALESGKVIAIGPKEQLQKLQDSLRKQGYRHVK